MRPALTVVQAACRGAGAALLLVPQIAPPARVAAADVSRRTRVPPGPLAQVKARVEHQRKQWKLARELQGVRVAHPLDVEAMRLPQRLPLRLIAIRGRREPRRQRRTVPQARRGRRAARPLQVQSRRLALPQRHGRGRRARWR